MLQYSRILKDYVLVFRGRFNPRYGDYENLVGHARSRAWAPALLQDVSNAVQAEVEPIFWGQHNQLIFPPGYWEAPHEFSCAGELWEERPMDDPTPPAKDLSYAFDMRDIPTVSDIDRRESALRELGKAETEATPAEIREKYVDMLLYNLWEIWDARCDTIALEFKLERLQLDLSACS